MTDTSKCEHIEVLLSGYLDDELTQQDAQRVRVHLENCAHCRQLHKELSEVKAQMKHLSYPKSDEEVLEALEKDLLAATSAGLGWGMLILAALIMGGSALFAWFTAPGIPLGVRLVQALFFLGGLGLFLSVLRQRLLTYKNDKYRKVKL